MEGNKISKFYEKTIKSDYIHKGKLVSLREDVVALPNGRQAKREIVEHPGAVAIVAVTSKKELVLVRQFRKAVDEELYEIPAGLANKGESRLEAARRELEEETGFKTERMRELFGGYVSPGYSSEMIRYFLATELSQSEQNLEEDEMVDVKLVGVERCWNMVLSGEIKDNKTIIGIKIVEEYLEKGNL